MIDSAVMDSLKNAKECMGKNDLITAVKNWRECLKYDPQNREAKNALAENQSQIKSLRDKSYLEGLGAYGKEDIEGAVLKWKDVLILDPNYEKAQLNIEKAERKKQR